MSLIAAILERLDNPQLARVVENIQRRIDELQRQPAVKARIIEVTLVNATATPIAHGLGRAPVMVIPSAPRGATSAGRIDEVRSDSTDRTKTVVLKATGYGATITLDLMVT